MAIFESIFDLLYLSLVIALGVRLLPEKKKGAKLFGIMAILLGLGDSFHLIPRVVSHLSPSGFQGHAFALSWGQFMTSMTMTVFYVLFYHFYRNQTGDRDNKKLMAIYSLAVLRILLILLPQNRWGQVPGDALFGIYRNIPFLIMGILLIDWSYKAREKEGLHKMWFSILLSFLFYIPVVLWSHKFPVVGALMMPKTVAYLMIVILGYKYFVGSFQRFNILGLAFTNLVMGLIAGVFYREFTKFYSFTGNSHLGKLHVHTLVLGFLVLLLIYLLSARYDDEFVVKLKTPIYLFITGLSFTVINMMVIGIYEVVSQGVATISMLAIAGISGLGHITLAVGLVMTVLRILQFEKIKTA